VGTTVPESSERGSPAPQSDSNPAGAGETRALADEDELGPEPNHTTREVIEAQTDGHRRDHHVRKPRVTLIILFPTMPRQTPSLLFHHYKKVP